MAGRPGACARSRYGAVCHRKAGNPSAEPPALNQHRLFPAVDIAVDPPDGSGTSFLRLYFSLLRSERKKPRRASALRGFPIIGADCSTKVKEPIRSPSPTAKKSPPVRLDFRAKAHSRGGR